MKRITPLDSAFLHAERPAAPPVIAGFFIVDPSTGEGDVIRHRDVLEHVEDRLHFSPALRQRLVFHPMRIGEPRLIDDENFDLEFHVRHLALPEPRDRRQLSILAARLFSRPMDLERPLWEMYIIEGLDQVDDCPKGAFAVLFKLHHAAFDGVAAGSTIFSMLQKHPQERVSAPLKRWVPERKPRMREWVAHTSRESVARSLSNLQSFPNVSYGMYKLARSNKDKLTRKTIKIPKTRFEGEVSSHKVFDYLSLPMATVHAARKKLGGAKVNDFALSIIAGGMRRNGLRKGDLTSTSLYALCPINVRGEGNPFEGGNHVSFMRVAMATQVEDPLERLQIIGQETLQGKDIAASIGPKFVGNAVGQVPYVYRSVMFRSFSKMTSRGFIRPAANAIVTNVPNPTGDHYFAGAKVVSYAGLGPVMDGYGLFHTITSLEHELAISITSCREMLPDIADYISDLKESADELFKLAEQIPVPSKTKRKTANRKPKRQRANGTARTLELH